MKFSLRSLLLALAWFVAAALFFASLPLWGESSISLLAPLEHLRIGYLFVAAVLLTLCLVVRSLSLGVFVGIITALNLWFVVPTLVGGSRSAGGPVHFSLLHANIWYDNATPSQTADMINREAPDIAVLLETFEYFQGGWLPGVKGDWPYRALCGDSACANMILSRWPITLIGERSPWRDGVSFPAMLAVRVHHPHGDFTLVAAHLKQPFDPVLQAEEAGWLAQYLKEIPQPIVLTGDFNSAPWSPLIRKLERDAGISRIAHTGPTWPSGPLTYVGIPIDHIFGGPGVTASSVRRLAPFGSDHLALKAEIELSPAPAGPAPLAGEGGDTPRLVPTR